MDPESGEPHIHKHRVIEAEVEEVLAGVGLRWKVGDGKSVAVGQTDGGRFLQVVFIEAANLDGPIFVITAYPAKKELVAACRRRMRKNGKR